MGNYMGDYAEGHLSLTLHLEGRVVWTPYLVKGYGPGILVHDWVEYAEADLRALEAAINQQVRARAGDAAPGG